MISGICEIFKEECLDIFHVETISPFPNTECLLIRGTNTSVKQWFWQFTLLTWVTTSLNLRCGSESSPFTVLVPSNH